MFIKQLSVFIENREGRLDKLTQTLSENGIDIVSLSLADTSEYGMLRMIVSDPQSAYKVVRDSDFTARLTDVIAVKLPNHFGSLNRMTRLLCKNDLDISYMYAFTTGTENASLVMKTSDNDKAVKIIAEDGWEFISEEEAYKL